MSTVVSEEPQRGPQGASVGTAQAITENLQVSAAVLRLT